MVHDISIEMYRQQIHLGGSIIAFGYQNFYLGPQNNPGILGTKNLLKIVSCEKIVLYQLK